MPVLAQLSNDYIIISIAFLKKGKVKKLDEQDIFLKNGIYQYQ